MINEIKEALDKATPRWHYNGNEIVSMDNLKYGIGGFMTDEDNHLAANAPEWLRYLIGEVERLKSVLKEISTDGIAVEEATIEELRDFIAEMKRNIDTELERSEQT